MKQVINILTSILILFLISCSGQEKPVWYVSPEGNDSWSGTIADPESGDGPFRTSARAREAVRSYFAKHGVPDSGVAVMFRAGTYQFTESLTLGKEDSGSKQAPTVWRAYPGEKVRFIGGRTISSFSPVTDTAIIDRFVPEARTHVIAVDLAAQGINDYGEIKTKGWHSGSLGMELVFGGEPMTIARYPNDGWLTIADVPQSGNLKNHGLDRDKSAVPRGRHFGRFTVPDNRPGEWEWNDDIWVHGYYVWDWADEYNRIERFDASTREVYPAEPYHHYGYYKGQRFNFLNVLEELDSPGEYYIDRDNGMLYFYPPADVDSAETMVSMLNDPIILLEEASNILISGIIFECSRGNAFKVSNGSNVVISGCTIRNLGSDGIVFEGGSENGIISSDIYNVEGGIMLGGGDRPTLTPGCNFAVNNHIHHYSRINRTYRVAATLNGVGNRFAHNHIHDAPHAGVLFMGNEHVLEFNEVHDIALETGDVGGFYIGRDWTMRGNIVRHNYFHDLSGPGLHGVMAVYLDDWASGTTIEGNVFRRAGRAAFVGGGRNNTIVNNIFIECEPSTHVDARGIGWAQNYFDGRTTTLTDRLDAMNYREPPFSSRYPILLNLYDDDPAVPKYNRFERNISWGGRFLDLYDHMDFDIVSVRNNIIGDMDICRWLRPKSEEYVTYERGDSIIMNELADNNFIVEGNPGVFDVETGETIISEGSPADSIGFTPIPFNEIGLYIDEYRTSLSQGVTP